MPALCPDPALLAYAAMRDARVCVGMLWSSTGLALSTDEVFDPTAIDVAVAVRERRSGPRHQAGHSIQGVSHAD